jgi:hypothetical protein
MDSAGLGRREIRAPGNLLPGIVRIVTMPAKSGHPGRNYDFRLAAVWVISLTVENKVAAVLYACCVIII